MEHQLQDLIDRIKKDGFEAAELEAHNKIRDAEEEAASILLKAREEAAHILETARKESAQMLENGRDALKQAARDLSITVEKDLKAQLDSILKEALVATYDSTVLQDAILAVVKEWAGLSEGSTLVLAKDQSDAIMAALKGKLAVVAQKGMEVKISPRIKAGFRIQAADGSSYYDFSSDTISRALSDYLASSVVELIHGKE